MKTAVGIACVIAAYMLSSKCALAQSYTDLNVVIGDLLKQAGPIPVTSTIQTRTPYQECHLKFIRGIGESMDQCITRYTLATSTVTQSSVLTFSNVTISASSPPFFSAAIYENFPQDLIENAQDYKNCSSAPLSTNISLTLNASRSVGVTVTNSVTHSQGLTLGASGSLFGIGASASMNISESQTSGTANSSGSTGGYSIGGSGSLTVPPHSRIIAVLRSFRMEERLPFSIPVVFDADVSPNDKGYKHLSDMLLVNQRTLPITGYLVSDQNSTGEMKTLDSTLGSSDCTGGTGLIVSNFAPTSNEQYAVSKMQIKSVQILAK